VDTAVGSRQFFRMVLQSKLTFNDNFLVTSLLYYHSQCLHGCVSADNVKNFPLSYFQGGLHLEQRWK